MEQNFMNSKLSSVQTTWSCQKYFRKLPHCRTYIKRLFRKSKLFSQLQNFAFSHFLTLRFLTDYFSIQRLFCIWIFASTFHFTLSNFVTYLNIKKVHTFQLFEKPKKLHEKKSYLDTNYLLKSHRAIIIKIIVTFVHCHILFVIAMLYWWGWVTNVLSTKGIDNRYKVCS